MDGAGDALKGHLARLDREATAPDWKAAVARLAKLSPVEYDRCREAEAESLGCRVATLDAEVKRARGDGASDGQGRSVEFPEVEPWPESVDGAALLEDVAAAIRRYVILPEHGAESCALWALMTWAAEDLDCLPMLRVLSPTRGCGKSTLLEVMAELVHRPMSASGISPAALYRLIEARSPTMLMDEADTYLKESEDHRQILNAGHTRAAAVVIRCVGEDQEPRAFNVFGPKLIAGIGSLPGTIEDRAVRIELRKRAPGEVIGSLRRDGRQQFADLRRRIRRWTDDNRAAIRTGAARAVLPEGLPDRAADNWSPLAAIADLGGAAWGERARRAALALTVTDAIAERSVMLLADLRDLFVARDTDRLATTDILEHLAGLEERPWVDCHRGKPIIARQLARWLEEFKVRSGSVRFPDGRNGKGYKLADLADAFARYLPVNPSQRHNVDVARVSGPIVSVTRADPVTAENGSEAAPLNACDVVTDKFLPEAAGQGKQAPAPGSADYYGDQWGREEVARLAGKKP